MPTREGPCRPRPFRLASAPRHSLNQKLVLIEGTAHNPFMEIAKTQVVVLGGGPGGYAAAFYAADKGLQVTLVEQEKRLGGACLNHGCIPSKALLHAVEPILEARESTKRGIFFEPPRIQLDPLRAWKDGILAKLGQGIGQLADRRKVQVVQGRGSFVAANRLKIESETGAQEVAFEHAIIATGSAPAMPAVFNIGSTRVMTSTQALELPEIPTRLLVIGGGYIGMELGTVYAALGSQVVVVEALDTILAGADPDLVRPVANQAKKQFKDVRLRSRVLQLSEEPGCIRALIETNGVQQAEEFDRVLVAVGRSANPQNLGLEAAGIQISEKGFIQVDACQRTSAPSILAIGDVVGGVMLAHKAAKEGRIAVDSILGNATDASNYVLPAVVFTDPEIAWCGVTETEARARGMDIKVTRFPWSASGRALTLDRVDGTTKLVVDSRTERILGVGIVGHGAGELIGEGVLAVQSGATASELAHAVHPHPTLSETLMEAAEAFFGTATHAITRRG